MQLIYFSLLVIVIHMSLAARYFFPYPPHSNDRPMSERGLYYISPEVIKYSITKVLDTSVFPQNDHNFLLHVLLAQQTIPPGDGGMYRITEDMLCIARWRCSRKDCTKLNELLRMKIELMCLLLTKEPLYSTAIMALYIAEVIGTIADTIEEQASQWVKYINPDGSKSMFLQKVRELQYDCKDGLNLFLLYDISAYSPDYYYSLNLDVKRFFSVKVKNANYALVTSSQEPKLYYPDRYGDIEIDTPISGYNHLSVALDLIDKECPNLFGFNKYTAIILVSINTKIHYEEKSKLKSKLNMLKRRNMAIFFNVGNTEMSFFRGQTNSSAFFNNYFMYDNFKYYSSPAYLRYCLPDLDVIDGVRAPVPSIVVNLVCLFIGLSKSI